MNIRGWQEKIHTWAIGKGFWKDEDKPPCPTCGRDFKRNRGEILALIHSEISEALEGLRHNNPPDEHVPQHNSFAVELADALIRILDTAEAEGIDLETVVVDKHAFNEGRPHKHGKEF